MMLTDAERDSLNECPDCGHYLNEHDDLSCSHSTAGCDCGCICFLSKASARLAAVEALIAARDQAWRERIRATADELDRIGTDCRDKRPMSGRWVGRAVAYRASASKLRALGEGATDA